MPEQMSLGEKYVRNIKRGDEYDVYIGRGSIYGNPFKIGRDGTREDVVRKYHAHLMANPDLLETVKQELRGKTLGCYCAPALCHGNILAVYANLDEARDNMHVRIEKRKE